MSDKQAVRMWRYVVQSDKGGSEWAVFLIDSTGMFAVVSDRGNYAFWWHAYGERDFRAFLAGLDGDYVRRKLHPDKEYDGDATLKAVKTQIRWLRRTHALDAKQAKHERGLLTKHNRLQDREDYALWAQDTTLDICELARYSPPNDILEFTRVIYPRFVELLKRDLAAEAQNVARPDS